MRVRLRHSSLGARGQGLDVTIVLGAAVRAQGMCPRLTLACAGAGSTRLCR